jgi:hypothetical protein
MDQGLTQILLDHMGGDSELLCDFLITLMMPVLQYYRSAAFWGQLIQ